MKKYLFILLLIGCQKKQEDKCSEAYHNFHIEVQRCESNESAAKLIEKYQKSYPNCGF